ncbi:MAG: hypothetical protein K8R92_00905 [Planctomycetes bacterium]|nr:hypothetical protein [Planctomycetota bacterium]
MKIELKPQAFEVPRATYYTASKNKHDTGSEEIQRRIELPGIPLDDLVRLCEEWRASVFKYARKSDPAMPSSRGRKGKK